MKTYQKRLIQVIGLVLIVSSFFTFTIQSTNSQAPHSYWAMENDLIIGAYGYYWGYGDLDAGDHIYGYIETASVYDGVDFFICNSANFDLWYVGDPCSGYEINYDMHLITVDFIVPSSDYWYFCFENEYPYYIELDFYFDIDQDDSPSYSTLGWDFVDNYEVLEPLHYKYYSLGESNARDTLFVDYATMFPTDGIDVYIFDEYNKDLYLVDGAYVPLFHIDGYFRNTFEVEIPTKGNYYIVLTSEDEYDTITYSFGVTITPGFPIYIVLIAGGAVLGALGVIIPVSVVAKRKKKARIDGEVTPKVPGTQSTTDQPSGLNSKPQESTKNGINFCAYCGKNLKPGAVFCQFCGKSNQEKS